MMKQSYRVSIILFLFISVFMGDISAAQLDPLLEKLTLSGYMRMRTWYTGSSIKIPGYFPGSGDFEQVNYEDLFFRNRIYISVLPELEIRSVFDISSKFGHDDFAMGQGGTNLVTRDVYALFRPGENMEFSLGLMPFSLPGGYILARDATGLRYQHDLLNKRLKLYVSLIRAFDDADTGYNDTTDIPSYADDNIFIFGGDLALLQDLESQVYYVLEVDRYTSSGDEDPDFLTHYFIDDGRQSTLHWLGIHNKYIINDFNLKFGAILNAGYIRTKAEYTDEPFIRTDILACLWEFEAAWKWRDLQVSLAAEGATGDPRDAASGGSFQDIKASHGFSLIAVDNTGGLAIRGSGESSWYGLAGQGLKFQYTLFNAVLVKLGAVHVRTLKNISWNGSSSTWYGDECDLEAEYKYREVLSVTASAAAFFPGDAYRGIVQDSSHGVILECMLGASVTY